MNSAAMTSTTQEIVVDEVLPHAPEVIWKTLTSGDLIGRWLMAPAGRGHACASFTPASSHQGTIRRTRR